MGLETVELVMTIESEFGLVLPEEAASTLKRLGDIHKPVLKVLVARGEPADANDVWDRIVAILRRDFAIPEESLTPEAHIVYDPGWTDGEHL